MIEAEDTAGVRAGSMRRLIARVAAERPSRFLQDTVVEIEVPSGRLVVASDLHDVPFCDIARPTPRADNGAQMDAWAHAFAAAGVAYAFTSDRDPVVTRRADGSLVVVDLAHDEALERIGQDPRVLEPGEVVVARTMSATWSTMLVDHDTWLAAGGRPVPVGSKRLALVEVPAGTHRWTAPSHRDDFREHRPARVEFARLEPVEASIDHREVPQP